MLQNWLLATPVEAFKDETGFVPVRDIQLLDVDQDGAPEAFVWIDPAGPTDLKAVASGEIRVMMSEGHSQALTVR